MLESFKPTWMVNSIYSITPEQLHKNGIRAILTDLDNTLIAWNNPKATPELMTWIEGMKEAGIPVIILSNNSDKRIKVVAENLGLDYVARSMKPTQRAFKIAAKKLDLPATAVVMVGDQILTDVLGANRAGVRSILVKPVVASDALATKFNRYVEYKIMKALIKSDQTMEWEDTLDEPISEP